MRTTYSTCSDVDTRGHAHSCSHSQAPLSVSHRYLDLFGNRLASLSPTQFAGLTSLTYVAIFLCSPAHARTHTYVHGNLSKNFYTRNGTCSTLLSSAFPVASLAFLPPFLCTVLLYADSSIRMRHGFLLRVFVYCVDVRQ